MARCAARAVLQVYKAMLDDVIPLAVSLALASPAKMSAYSFNSVPIGQLCACDAFAASTACGIPPRVAGQGTACQARRNMARNEAQLLPAALLFRYLMSLLSLL